MMPIECRKFKRMPAKEEQREATSYACGDGIKVISSFRNIRYNFIIRFVIFMRFCYKNTNVKVRSIW